MQIKKDDSKISRENSIIQLELNSSNQGLAQLQDHPGNEDDDPSRNDQELLDLKQNIHRIKTEIATLSESFEDTDHKLSSAQALLYNAKKELSMSAFDHKKLLADFEDINSNKTPLSMFGENMSKVVDEISKVSWHITPPIGPIGILKRCKISRIVCESHG